MEGTQRRRAVQEGTGGYALQACEALKASIARRDI